MLYSAINYWTKCCILGFYLKHHEWLLGFFIQLDIVMPFSSPQLELDWESICNFLRLERNLHICGHIFLAVSIFLFWPTKARGTNVRQFPTRSNFQIMNILCCFSVISFYFPPLEVVHPVAFGLCFLLFRSVSGDVVIFFFQGEGGLFKKIRLICIFLFIF